MQIEKRQVERARVSGRGTSSSGLPEAILARAGQRLGTTALLVAATYVFFSGLQYFFFIPDGYEPITLPPPGLRVRLSVDEAVQIWTVPPYTLGATVFAVLTSIAVWALSRSGRIEPARLVTVGLIYEVAIAAALAAGLATEPGAYYFPMVGITWIAFWIGIFPLLVPAEPRRVLVAALLSTAALPVALVSIGPILVGFTHPPAELLMLTLPQLVATAWAYVGARVVTQYGREIKRARQMGSYELVERLGAGGMGEVWRARHRFLARPAAIKLIRPETLGGADEDRALVALRRFEREAQAIAGLRSPNTIQIYDFGVADDGTFFYVMELLEGLDLETLVERHGPLPQERVVDLLLQVCDSLTEAHEQGLLHRDIKPANIYVCRYGRRFDVVKVLDFGLVRAVGSDGGSRLTREGTFAGTPAYMAPEQAMGEGIDARADLYSLGCVAYWLLTGVPVFEADNPMKMVLKHTGEEPVPPSLRGELPIDAALESLVLSCLAKRPDDRPADAEQLAARLRGLKGMAWNPERARAWWHVHFPDRDAPPRVESLAATGGNPARSVTPEYPRLPEYPVRTGPRHARSNDA